MTVNNLIVKPSDEKRPKDAGAPHPDNRYIEGLLAGERTVIEEIYDRFLPRITRFICSNSGSPEDAFDVFQDATIIILKKSEQKPFRLEKASFYTYLYGICRNLWLRELAYRRKADGLAENKDFSNELLEFRYSEWEEAVTDRENYKMYMKAFLQLGDRCKKILELFFQGKSMSEIGRFMNHGSVEYTKQKKYRCQKRLLSLIKKNPKYKLPEENEQHVTV